MVRYNNVSYKVKQKVILDNISFEIKNYEKVLLVGPSGSGKSTIFNLLMKYIKPTSGNIYVNKKDIFTFNKKQTLLYRQNKISMISQKDDLFDNLTVLENLTLFFYENDVIEKLKQFDLFTLKDRMVSSLSGGERQRIAIIKECLFSFDILLCDEITSALDKENAIKIIDFILNVFKDKTIIFISHDESKFTNKIDHIIKINDKKIVEDIIINKLEHKSTKSKQVKQKKLMNVAIKQAIKHISIPLFLICILSIICFFVCLNFNDFYNYFSIKSYKQYFNYDVLFIKDNTNLKENNKDIFIDMSKEVLNSKIYINDISVFNINVEPFNNKGSSSVVINTLLLDNLNINEINSFKIKGDNIDYLTHTVDIIYEENMFSVPTIYIDNEFFLNNYDTNNKSYILISPSFIYDERFTNNPLFENKKDSKPYLDSKAYQDYLMVEMIFTSLQDIVNYYFIMIFFYTIVCSILINVSLCYKDIKRIGIYISKGYDDYQIMLIYVLPLFIYFVISLLFLLISIKSIISILITFLLQIISIIASFYFIKNKSLNTLLKEEVYI